MGKGRKRVPPAREAAQSFWACVLDQLEDTGADPGLSPLPDRFTSPAAYFSSLATLVLAESRALARNAWWRHGCRASAAKIGARSSSQPGKTAKQRGIDRKLLSFKVAVSSPGRDWPSLRTAWLVELKPQGAKDAALFCVERAAVNTGHGQEMVVCLCGFAPRLWGWQEGSLAEQIVAAELRPVEDLVPSLRMWTACCLAPKPPFLHQIVGAPEAKHQVFSDSDASEDEEEEVASGAPMPSGGLGGSSRVPHDAVRHPSMLTLNPLQRDAVTRILASDGFVRRCHLLQGPPGTGKTRVVIALLQQLSLRHASGQTARGRILISAPSNGAVQVALEHFLKTEEGQCCPLCLVGVDERVPSEGPLRAAFIHTRVQHALTILKRCAEDSAHLPDAAQAIETLRRSVPAAYRRLRLPASGPISGALICKRLTGGSDGGGGDGASSSSSSCSSCSDSSSSDEDDKVPTSRHRAVRGSLLERLSELARRERFGEAPEFESDQLKAAASVFCTLSCSGRPGMQHSLHDGVETVLVDEAAQAIEAETLVPLCLGPRQLVLVGDPMQLSATVCHSDAARNSHFCRSMMERLMGLGQEYIMLREQYRMHPEISRFPSARFYRSGLVDVVDTCIHGGSTCDQTTPGVLLPPYAVVNVWSGEEDISRREGQITNTREAKVLATFAAQLAGASSRSKESSRCPAVVVITFYNGQAALIRRLLSEATGTCFSKGKGKGSLKKGTGGSPLSSGIEVHTVDSFQGSEAEIVLLSFVRANRQRRLGFLSEFRRLNVALTRAKRSLVVFANASLLSDSEAKSGTAGQDDVAALFADAMARKLVWPEAKVGSLLSVFKMSENKAAEARTGVLELQPQKTVLCQPKQQPHGTHVENQSIEEKPTSQQLPALQSAVSDQPTSASASSRGRRGQKRGTACLGLAANEPHGDRMSESPASTDQLVTTQQPLPCTSERLRRLRQRVGASAVLVRRRRVLREAKESRSVSRAVSKKDAVAN